MSEERKLTIKEVVDAAVNIFMSDCISIAEENWGENHSSIDMLKRVMVSALTGDEYAEITQEEIERIVDELKEVQKNVELNCKG